MSEKFLAGAVWTGQFNFEDGQERRKYFVLVNDAGETGHFICAVTTSQLRYQVTSSACGSRAYRIEPGEVACFDKKTWIQFDNLFYRTKAELGEHEKCGARFLQSLGEDKILGVLSCATKSDDIRGYDVNRIETALEARRTARKAREEERKKKASTPPSAAVSSTASAEVLAIRARYNKRCSTCQTNFADVLELDVTMLRKIFSGAKEPAKTFGGDADAGFDILHTNLPCTTCKEEK